MNTPWGPSQEIYPVIEGIVFVSTAGHGGLKLEVWRQARMPLYLRRPGGWYEEDCEWSLPAAVFAAEILAGPESCLRNAVHQGAHQESMRDWFPDEYERFYQTVIPPGQSFKKDERQFYRDHAEDWIGICAYGDWKEGVPIGYVGVVARQGGHGGQGPEKFFYVPKDEYDQRGPHGFVIDRHRHTEVALHVEVTKRVG